MADIILSIKPRYAKKILTGEKRFEFRKQIPKQEITWVYIYSSSPVKKIVGRFRVDRMIEGSPQYVWERCKNLGGVEEEEFLAYCGEKDIIHGLEIGEIEKFKQPIDPYEGNSDFIAPQNFAYVGNDRGKIRCVCAVVEADRVLEDHVRNRTETGVGPGDK